MIFRMIGRRLPEIAIVAVLALLGPACGGGGSGGGAAFTSGAPPGSSFTPSVVWPPGPFLNRTTGVAPMGVFCCAANAYQPGSTTTLIPQPAGGDYGTFKYVWDFGDPGSGTWPTNGMSKNAARGYTAAHIYQTPGTYTITCTLTDDAGVTTVFTQDVTVSAFAGTTYYISAAGNDANDGLSPATSWATVGKVFANIGTNRQFLFNRGDSFSAVGPYQITQPGPGLIGAYGSGAQPIINITGNSGLASIRQSDWTVQDLEIIGPGTSDLVGALYFDETKQISRILWQRLTVHEFRTNLGWTDWPTMYSTPHDGDMISECVAYNSSVNGFYLGGRHLALLGNVVRDCVGSHITRVWQAHKAVIAHNQFLRPGNDRHSLKLHGPTSGDGRPETQFVTVSDNTFQGNTWVVTVGPQNATYDERISQCIFERNTWNSAPLTQVGIVLAGRKLTVRNNIFDGTGSFKYYVGMLAGDQGYGDPIPMDLHLFNNTVYKNDVGDEFTIVAINSRVSDVIAKNNFGSGNNSARKMTTSGTAPNVTLDHNVLTATPGFVNAAAGDFHLAAGSPGIDGGIPVQQVWEDKDGVARPAGAAFDLGAYEQ